MKQEETDCPGSIPPCQIARPIHNNSLVFSMIIGQNHLYQEAAYLLQREKIVERIVPNKQG